MLIRKILRGERSQVCDLQIASWRAAYANVLPASFLKEDIKNALNVHWSREPGDNWIVLGAWQGAYLLGFVALDLTHEGGPYIDNLHVSPAAHRRGTGRALMADLARRLIGLKQETCWLTVVESNTRARAFYRALGGVEGPVRGECILGYPVDAYPVRWADMSALK